MSNTVIAGRYELQGLLGEGAFGTVHRAFDRVLHRAVAIKLFGDRRRPDRIITEARAAARLAHTAIVTIHDVGSDGGQPYLVMELVDGESLRARLRRGSLDRATAATWLRAIADALATAHAAGTVHLDVKPENVLVTATGQVKVTDFGLARLVDTGDAVVPSRIAGTLRYMAPEQLAGEPIDARADQYAWSVLAFELLAGIHPRDLRSDVDDRTYALAEHPPRVNEVAPASTELAAVLARGMAKRPEHRFPTMRDVVRAWDGAIDRPAAPPEPQRSLAATIADTPSARRRSPIRYVIALVGALGIAAAVAARGGGAAAPATSSTPAPSTDAAAVAVLPQRPPPPPVEPTPVRALDARPAPAKPVEPVANAKDDSECRSDADCHDAERCVDRACERMPYEMPWKAQFSPKSAVTTCDDSNSLRCGMPCTDASECEPGEVCTTRYATIDGKMTYLPKACSVCPAGHVWVRTTGDCHVPCAVEEDCPYGFECSARFGRKTCQIL
jgi:serine/threonine-protein kinase